MEFDEKVFIWALTTRPEDAKRFTTTFSPSWLGEITLQPILTEIYSFTKKYGEPPSLSTLHKVFKDKDEELYNLRYQETLKDLEKEIPDKSEVLFVLDKAKSVAIVRSFLELSHHPGFVEKQVEYDGDTILKEVYTWITKFSDSSTDRTMDLKEAIENLIQHTGFHQTNERIPVGILPLDDWTGGGLRRKQLGLIIAPTGHGKTAVLTLMAHKIASIEQKRVWLITNELPTEEITERLLTRITGIPLEEIMEDPIIGYSGLNRHWQQGLHNRLRITEINREVSSDDIEGEMAKWANLQGWKPDVIILDFMERMKPSLSGYKRDKEWQWLGAIAKDLVRMAKRHNIIVWSAAQTNREGLDAPGGISANMAQSSIRHLQECTAVIGMNQIEIPGSEKIGMQFKSLKQRQSKRIPRPIVLECDLAKMNIKNEVIDIQAELEESMGGENDDDTEKDYTPLHKQRNKKRRY